MDYFDRLKIKAKENWQKYMELDGITNYYTVEEFYAEMQKENGERLRAKQLIESRIPTTMTVSIFKGGLSNYFIINDICYGEVCEKCNSTGAVILLTDKDNTVDWDKKILLPSIEYYYVLGIEANDIEFLKYTPIPVNPKTDFWYCPYCNELHKFKYNSLLKAEYNQAVVNMDIDVNKYLKKDSDLIRFEQIKKFFKLN